MVKEVEEYKSKDFCKGAKCPVQQLLDNKDANLPDQLKILKRHCKTICKANEFHQWLKQSKYSIIRFLCKDCKEPILYAEFHNFKGYCHKHAKICANCESLKAAGWQPDNEYLVCKNEESPIDKDEKGEKYVEFDFGCECFKFVERKGLPRASIGSYYG